jgi:hypothetical protein
MGIGPLSRSIRPSRDYRLLETRDSSRHHSDDNIQKAVRQYNAEISLNSLLLVSRSAPQAVDIEDVSANSARI